MAFNFTRAAATISEAGVAKATTATDRQHRYDAAKDIRAERNLAAAEAAAAAPVDEAKKTRSERRAGKKNLQANTTDPDSRVMITSNGWVQGFNAQIVVSDDHLILAITLTQDPTDTTWFEPMMHAAVTAVDTILEHQPATDTDQGPSGSV